MDNPSTSGPRRATALSVALAVIISSVVIGVAAGGPTVHAREAPTGPLPVCVIDDDGDRGLGCFPEGAFTTTASGNYDVGSSFTVSSTVPGVGPCFQFTDTGCHIEIFRPTISGCVYLAEGDPRDVRSCASSLSSNGAVSAMQQGTCSGRFGNVYAAGGPTADTFWISRAAAMQECEFAVTGGEIDLLDGPTFMQVRVGVYECVAIFGGWDCTDRRSPPNIYESHYAYAWIPVIGTLRPRASFDTDEVSFGSFRFDNTSVPFEGGATTFEWDFGDGSTSTVDSPTHAFAASGSYDVTLTMRGSGGRELVTSETIEVDAALRVSIWNPEADFGPDGVGNRIALGTTMTARVEVEVPEGAGRVTGISPTDGTVLALVPDEFDVQSGNELMNPFDLDAGESRTFDVLLDATAEGRFTVRSEWSGDAASGPLEPVDAEFAGEVESALLVDVEPVGLVEDEAVNFFELEITVENPLDIDVEDVEFVQGVQLFTSTRIPAEERGEIQLIGDAPDIGTLAAGETATIQVFVDPQLDGFVDLGSMVTGTVGTETIEGRGGAEFFLQTEGITNDELEIIVQILMQEALADALLTMDGIGTQLGKGFAGAAPTSCAAPTAAPQSDARVDLALYGLGFLFPQAGPALLSQVSDQSKADTRRFLMAEADVFFGNLRDAYLGVEGAVVEGSATTATFYRDLVWAAGTGDSATRDRMIADFASVFRDTAESGIAVGSAVWDELANMFVLAPGDEGRLEFEVSRRYLATEQRITSSISKMASDACQLIGDRISKIWNNPDVESAQDDAAELYGDVLSFVFVEGLAEITGTKVVDLASDAWKAQRGLPIPDVDATKQLPTTTGGTTDRPRPTSSKDWLSDEEIAGLPPEQRRLAIEAREAELERLAREIPADELLSLDDFIRRGGLNREDAQKAQQIVAELEAKYDVNIELELRGMNPHSLQFWEEGRFRGPDGQPVLPTPKNELAKAKNGADIDVLLGMDPKGLGRLALYEPISRVELHDLLASVPPSQAKQLRLRWNSQKKYWNAYQDYTRWLTEGQTGELGGFAKILAESTGGRTFTKDIATPGKAADALLDPTATRTRTLSLDVEKVGSNTILLNDFTKPLEGGGFAPIVSDADWHAAVITDGSKRADGLRGAIETELEYRLARETKTFGGHGMSVNGNDFRAGDNSFRLEFLYEQLPDHIARRLLEVRGDSVDLSKIVTDQRVIKISSSGYSIGYGALPGAGWVSPGKSKYDINRYRSARKPAKGPVPRSSRSSDPVTAVFTVDVTYDSADVTPGNGVCNDAWGMCPLRAALMESSALDGIQRVEIPAGTYQQTLADDLEEITPGGTETGRNGDFDVVGGVEIVGAGSESTRLFGRNAFRLFDLVSGPVTLEGLTIDAAFAEGDGGAVRANGVDLILNDVVISNSVAGGDGGAIFVGASNLVIRDSHFESNAAVFGGAVVAEYSNVTIENTTFERNAAQQGGALVIQHSAGARLDDVDFIDNSSSAEGGAMVVRGLTAEGSTEIALARCLFLGNRTAHGVGGGLFVDGVSDVFLEEGAVSVTDCRFEANAAHGGGAIWAQRGRVEVAGTEFENNFASGDVGGAVYSFEPIEISSSSFTGNQADDDGPAIFAESGVEGASNTFDGNEGFSTLDGETIVGGGLTGPELIELESLFVVDVSVPDVPTDPEPDSPVVSSITPVSPARLVDTRPGERTVDGQLAGVGAVSGGSSLRVPVRGRGGVPASATAVVVNTVAVRPSAPGFLTLFPCDEDRPSTSSVNFGARPVDVNGALVKLSADGALCVFASAAAEVVLDVTAFAEGDEALPPARIAESRRGQSTDDGQQAGFGRVSAGSVTTVDVAGRGGVPEDAAAVAVNVTVVRPSGPGFVTLFPCDEDRPLASSLNYGPGDVRPNSAIVTLSSAGTLCVFSSAETDVIVDVTASFASVPGFSPLNPARLLETRAGNDTVDGESESIGRLAPGSVTRVQVAGRGGVPADAVAAAVNVAAVRPSAPGFITLFPCDEDRPLASSMNYVAGDVIANSGVVKLAADGSLCVFSRSETDLVLDVNAAWAN